MKKIDFSTSTCRFCRFYNPEGRRGGSCQMLAVPVESSWKACNFASPPFDTTLKKLEDIFCLETVKAVMPLDSNLHKSSTQFSSNMAEIKVNNSYKTEVYTTSVSRPTRVHSRGIES